MKEGWFQTWSRPEYLEWALPQDYGYLLVVARKQSQDWLLAKAKLVFEEEGLPNFEILETEKVKSEGEAITRVNKWKDEAV